MIMKLIISNIILNYIIFKGLKLTESEIKVPTFKNLTLIWFLHLVTTIVLLIVGLVMWIIN